MEIYSIIIAGVALISAIASPLISALINANQNRNITKLNHEHEYMMNAYNNYFLQRSDAVEAYIRSAGQICNIVTSSEYRKYRDDYNKRFAKIYLFVDEGFWPQLDEIDRILSQDDTNSYKSARPLVIALGKEFSKLNLRKPDWYK